MLRNLVSLFNSIQIFIYMEKKICASCEKEKELTDFYKQKDRKSGSTLCKECFNKYCIQRWIDTKIKAIEYKGNKCCDCDNSYPNKPYVIFDFHHRNPKQKDVDWGKLRKRSWLKIKGNYILIYTSFNNISLLFFILFSIIFALIISPFEQ